MQISNTMGKQNPFTYRNFNVAKTIRLQMHSTRVAGVLCNGWLGSLPLVTCVFWCVLQVWCDDGYPRLVQRPLEIALTGKMSKRCACYKETELDQPGLELYEGCDYLSKACRL